MLVFAAIAARVLSSSSSPRAQITSDAPSADSSSAIARPSPRLAAVTRATRPRRPRSMRLLPRCLAQIAVGLVEPVLPRRAEDVDIERVLESLRLVRHVRWDVQYLARRDDQLVASSLADPEAQRSLEDVGELLVLVRMRRDDAALLQVDVGEHHALTGDEAPVEKIGDLLLRHVAPAVPGDLGGGSHGPSDQLGFDVDLHAGQRLRDRAPGLRILDRLLECGLVDTRDRCAHGELHRGDAEARILLLDGAGGFRLDLRGRSAGALERSGERHAEARCLGRSKQLLGVGSGSALEARSERVGAVDRATLSLEASLASLEAPFPCRV